MIEVVSNWINIVGFFQGVRTGRYSEALAFRMFVRSVSEYLLKFGKFGGRTCGLRLHAYTLNTKIEVSPKTMTTLERMDFILADSFFRFDP